MNAHAIDFTYPLIVDSFAGGGGASTGIEDALAELIAEGILPPDHPDHVTLAINHDDAALAMHAANHPRTIHLPHNVWKVSLAEIVGARRIGLVWMSPDCRHHSKAKGGAPVSPSVRDLAWVAMRWLKELRPEQRPRKIFLENVEEFRKWGPLDADGKPDRAREGETFNAWVRELKKLGYRRVEWRELRACDFGVPTIRKRLYLVASMDGEIVWPEPTHGDPRSEAVREGRLLPWRTAASDVIDWSLPCPSIFMTKAEAKAYRLATGKAVIRPLAPKTHARIAKGVKRYVLDATKPFVVTCNHGGKGFRGQDVDEPMVTATAARDAHGVVVPHLQAYYGEGRGGADRSAPADEPLRVVTTEPRHALIAPHVMAMRNSGKPFSAADEPTHTVMAGGAGLAEVAASVAPFVTYGQQGGASRSAEEPHHTVTASSKDTNGIAVGYLVPRYGERPGQEPRTRDVDAPMPVVVPTGNGGDLAAVYLAQHNGGRLGQSVEAPAPTAMTRGTQTHVVAATFVKRDFGASVGHAVNAPAGTVTPGGGGKMDLVAVHMAQHNNDGRRIGGVNPGREADAPVSAITASGCQQGVVAATLSHAYTSNTAGGEGDPGKPIKTVVAGGNHASLISLPLMTAYYSTGGQHADVGDPMLTVPTKGRFGLVEADAVAPEHSEFGLPLPAPMIDRARQVAAFLREHGCWDEREFVTVEIVGVLFVVVDIGMRMLTARELARAQGFRDDYVLAAPFKGGTLTDTDQRHKIGNSVCPPMARALIRSNYRLPAGTKARPASPAPLFLEAAE